MRKIILTVGSFFILLNIKIFAFQVVLVTADPMTSNDIHIETEISSLFGTPLYQYGNQDPTGNINSGDVVYITADADISMYASMYESLPNGIVVANSAALEMLYLCSTGDSGTDYGIMGTVQNSTHEICQGLSGTISLLNNSASRIICHPANDGQFLISTYSNTSNCVTAAFTQNALMAGGYTATGRRASFYFKTGTLSPDGITILSNVILWAAGSTGGSSSSINSSFPVNSSSSVFFSSTSTAGNSSSGGSDTQAPWLDIHNSVEMESGLDSLTNTFSLSGTVTDNSPVEWADLQFTTTVNGTNWISEYMPLSWDQSGFWEKTNINLDVPVGVYSLTIRLNAADIHGNENPFYASNILFVKETPPDTQPPTAAVTNPVPGAIITGAKNSLVFSGTCSDERSGISNITLYIYNIESYNITLPAQINNNSWNCTWDISNIAQNDYNYYIECIDQAGNQYISPSAMLTYIENSFQISKKQRAIAYNSVIDLDKNPVLQLPFVKDSNDQNITFTLYNKEGKIIYTKEQPITRFNSSDPVFVWRNIPEELAAGHYFARLNGSNWEKILLIILTR